MGATQSHLMFGPWAVRLLRPQDRPHRIADRDHRVDDVRGFDW